MRAKTNTITINGRTYDTSTGKPIEVSQKHTTQDVVSIVAPSKDHAQKVVSPSVVKPTPVAPKAKKITVTESRMTPKEAPQKVAVRVARRQTERSTTLMRHAVKKPTHTTRTHAVSGLTAQPKTITIQGGVSKVRDSRVHQYSRSSQISRFAHNTAVTKRTAHIPVAAAPAPKTTQARPSYDISDTPPVPHVAKPATLREQHRDLFETAIQQSTSHSAKKHPVHKKGRRAARLALGAASLVIVVAFFAYQSAPSLALKRASSTIGFTASIPSYRPSGFRVSGPVQYDSGKVTIDFRSNSDSRAYTVTQAVAYNDDYSLRSKFLKDKPFEPVSMLDQTGYFYGNANLTWVKNGIWYNIQGDSQLSRDQLIHVASSLF